MSPGSNQDQANESSVNVAVEGLRGVFLRALAWLVGGIFGVVGAVTTIHDLWTHHHGIGPYLLAGGLFFLFLAVLDMWRVERSNHRRQATRADQNAAALSAEKLESARLIGERDHWQRLHAEESAQNRRLLEELYRTGPAPQGGRPIIATTTSPISTSYPYTVHGRFVPPGWPGYREPPDPDQGTLFDREDPDDT